MKEAIAHGKVKSLGCRQWRWVRTDARVHPECRCMLWTPHTACFPVWMHSSHSSISCQPVFRWWMFISLEVQWAWRESPTGSGDQGPSTPASLAWAAPVCGLLGSSRNTTCLGLGTCPRPSPLWLPLLVSGHYGLHNLLHGVVMRLKWKAWKSSLWNYWAHAQLSISLTLQINLLMYIFFQVTRYIHHKIIGKLHDAKVVLALGNTVWIDPMVRTQFS